MKYQPKPTSMDLKLARDAQVSAIVAVLDQIQHHPNMTEESLSVFKAGFFDMISSVYLKDPPAYTEEEIDEAREEYHRLSEEYVDILKNHDFGAGYDALLERDVNRERREELELIAWPREDFLDPIKRERFRP